MGQCEVLKVLKENSNWWMNTKQIRACIPNSPNTVCSSAKIMREAGEVLWKYVRQGKNNVYVYKYK